MQKHTVQYYNGTKKKQFTNNLSYFASIVPELDISN